MAFYIFGIGFLAGVLNLVVAWILYRKWRQTSGLERFILLLIVNNIALIVCYVFPVSSFFHGRWLYGHTYCSVYAAFAFFNGICQISLMTAVAIFRMRQICHLSQISGSHLVAGAVISALYSAFWAICPFLGFGEYGPEPNPTTCSFNWLTTDDVTRLYIIVITVGCFVIPVVAICFCYGRIWWVVRNAEKRASKGVRGIRSNHTLKIWQAMTFSFVVGWGPYTAVSFASLHGYGDIIPMFGHVLPLLFAKMTTCFCPIIYLYSTRRIRLITISRSNNRSCRTLIRQSSMPFTDQVSLREITSRQRNTHEPKISTHVQTHQPTLNMSTPQ